MESVALEVAIGLVLVFLVTALLADAVNEIASRSLNIRSKALWARLEELMTKKDIGLGYGFIWKGINWNRPSVSKSVPEDVPQDVPQDEAQDKRLASLVNTGSIRALDYVKQGKKTKVWKIPGDVFASAVIELAQSQQEGESLKEKVGKLAGRYPGTPLGAFLGSTGKGLAGDTQAFVDGVGQWFDAQMEVLSNTYRRNVRLILGVIGIFVAVVFNVNAITIGQQLADNAALRQSAVVIASDLTAKEITACSEKVGEEEQVKCAAKKIALFTDAGVIVPFQDNYFNNIGKVWNKPGGGPNELGIQLFGIAITAVAVSFGGTFWFDFLRFLTGVRKGTGKP